MRRTPTSAAGIALVAALLLAGCGGGSTIDDRKATADVNPSAGSPPTPTAPPGDDPTAEVAFGDPGETVSSPPGADNALTVTDVRAVAGDGFDRVVLQLGGVGTPGWEVSYVDEAVDDASGEPVTVNGAAVLAVRVTGTGTPADTGISEYGGDAVTLPGGAIRQVLVRPVFEGTTTAFVGVDAQRPFRVFALEDPVRVVIDVER